MGSSRHGGGHSWIEEETWLLVVEAIEPELFVVATNSERAVEK